MKESCGLKVGVRETYNAHLFSNFLYSLTIEWGTLTCGRGMLATCHRPITHVLASIITKLFKLYLFSYFNQCFTCF